MPKNKYARKRAIKQQDQSNLAKLRARVVRGGNMDTEGLFDMLGQAAFNFKKGT
jgi:hypothetical protein